MGKAVDMLRTVIFTLLMFHIIEVVISQAPSQSEVPPIKTEPDDPWYGQKLPPQPRPGYYRYLGHCIDVLTRSCGKQIDHYIFEDKVVDRHCCHNLQKMGKLCSKAISFTLGQIAKFKPQAAKIIQKNDELFDKCTKF